MFSKDNKKAAHQKEKDQKPTYWQRVIQGKGTVAEDWPTAEELWNDPDLKKEIEEVQATLNHIKEAQN